MLYFLDINIFSPLFSDCTTICSVSSYAQFDCQAYLPFRSFSGYRRSFCMVPGKTIFNISYMISCPRMSVSSYFVVF